MKMFGWFKKKEKEIVFLDEVTLKQVKDAIGKFVQDKRKEIKLSILIQDDHSIDFQFLEPYLAGIPKQRFYMSKQTYDIFEEKDKEIPLWMDKVQKVVDKYISIERNLPIIPHHPKGKLNYLLLVSKGYLKETPPYDFYLIEEEEHLIMYKQ